MYAFVIIDRDTGTLFMGRDPFGEKPLYYSLSKLGISFASTILACIAGSGQSSELNVDALSEYLMMRYIPSPKTLERGVQQLPAGCFAVFRRRKLVVQRYFEDRISNAFVGVFIDL